MGKFKGAKKHLLVAAVEFSRLVIQNSFGFVLGTRKRNVKLQNMDISVMFVDLFLKTRGSSNTMCESIAKQRKFTNALHVTKLLGRSLTNIMTFLLN